MQKLGIGLVLLLSSLCYFGLLIAVLLAEASCKQIALCNSVARIAENHDTTGLLVSLLITGVFFGIGLRLITRSLKRRSSEDADEAPKSKRGGLKLVAGLVILAGTCFEVLFLWRTFENCKNFDPCQSFANSFNSVDVVTQITVAGGVLFFIMLGILTFIKRGKKEE